MVALAMTALAFACATEPSLEGAPLEGAVLESARYLLAWDATGTDLEGDERVIENDLGLAVRIARAHVVSHSASMIACEPIAPALSLVGLLGPSIARAGHGDSEDPSTTPEPATEDLVAAHTIQLGAPVFPRQGYCRLHYVVGVTGDARSLEIAGTSEGAPFTLSTTIATGMLLEMDELATTGDGAHAEITFVRPLATLFDGIDPAAVDPEEGARAVLRNLIAGTEVSIAR